MASANPLCSGSAPIALPPLSSATPGDLDAVRALVDAHRFRSAAARWASATGWSPARGATAFGRADALFSAQRYSAAFRLFGANLFCGRFTELNPAAEDSGAADLLESALQHAARNELDVAQTQLQRAAQRDPASIESRYFLGLVEFARGHPATARRSWQSAIDDSGYAQPPDGWTLPRAQEAAIQRTLLSR